MDMYTGEELDKRYNEYKAELGNKKSKAVIDLVLQAYIPENAHIKPANPDPKFRALR